MKYPKRAKIRYTKNGFIVYTWTAADGHVIIDVPFSEPKDTHEAFFEMEGWTQ